MKGAIEQMVFGPNSKPYGISYPRWTVRWWRWLLSFPKEYNPALDISGGYSDQRQDDSNVWFLAGTFGGLAERKCRIPSGKAILMPVINYECSFAEEPLITTRNGLESKCKSEIDDIKKVSFLIDETIVSDLSPYRIRSPLFSIQLRDNNVLGLEPCLTKMISDGFWVFLRPLTIGRHHVRAFGSCRSGKIQIGVTYNLFVS
jgi:hypothetical protein